MKLLGLKVSGAMGDFVPFFRVTRGLHINTKYVHVHLELFHMASCFKCKVLPTSHLFFQEYSWEVIARVKVHPSMSDVQSLERLHNENCA